MKNKKKKLCITLLAFFMALSIYSTKSHRDLQREMGIMYTSMYQSLNAGIELVRDDISRFEIDKTVDYSKLLHSRGAIGELKASSRNLPSQIGSIYPFLLRNIEIDLHRIINEEESIEEKEKRLEAIKYKFDILTDLHEVMEEQIEKNNPLTFFKQINSPESNASKLMTEIFNEYVDDFN